MFTRVSSSRRIRRSAFAAPLVVGLAAFALADETPTDASKDASKAAACCAKSCCGALTGIWTGEYRYPEGVGQRPVTFTAFLIQDGDRITAEIKEPNSFGDQTSPWLHATADGKYDEETKTLSFVKSYDGTAGASHDVVYKGALNEGATQAVSGNWDIGGLEGSFTMKRKN
jgi:hypothetical protein